MIPLRNAKRFLSKALKQPVYALRVLRKRSLAYWDYSFSRGKSRAPEAVTLFLTHRCNLRCKMCGQWGESGVTRQQGSELLKQELSLDELKKLVDELARFKPAITLFGGEPLLFPGCVGLVEYIKRKGMHVLMITNGSLLREHAEGLVNAGLDELNVSLDGDKDLHDLIRGLPGVFERIKAGLEQVAILKERKGGKKPLVNLQCTITKYNYRHLEELTRVAGQVKADSLTFHNLIFLSERDIIDQEPFDRALGCSSESWKGFVSDPGIDPAALAREKERIAGGKYGFSLDFYPDFSRSELKDYYTNSCYRPARQNCRCVSPWLVAYVFPDGQIRPCLNSSYSFGSVKEGFLRAWNSSRSRDFRRELKYRKIFPVCKRCTELYRY